MNDVINITQNRNSLREAKVSSMPIPYNQKVYPKKGWTEMDEVELWSNTAYPSNIAIIAGRNNLVIIDADDEQTTITLNSYFSNMGVNHVGTESQRGNHRWVRSEVPIDFPRKSPILANEMDGEVRLINGYALAAPSIVDDYRYSQIGNPLEIPYVEWSDIRELIKHSDLEKQEEYDQIPIPVLRRELPDWIKDLSKYLAIAPSGEMITIGGKYWKSRSEAAYSAMLSLLLRGYSGDEIIKILQMDDKDDAWYERTITNAIQAICNEGDRPKLTRLCFEPFIISGKTGAVDLAVFRAIVALAWFVNKMEIYLPSREIAQLAAVTINTASDALKRLTKLGYLEIVPGFENARYPLYRFNTQIIVSIEDDLNNIKLINEEIRDVSYVSNLTINQELWHRDILGKRGQLVYTALDDDPKSIEELMVVTGRSYSTVYRALKKLRKENLAIKKRKNWIKGKADPNDIAEQLGCNELRDHRKKRIENERKEYSF